MLNGTLVAVQRALTCMVENWFIGGVIKIPEVLWGYVGCEEIRLSEGK
jgi:seryl-tRNA synthetase